MLFTQKDSIKEDGIYDRLSSQNRTALDIVKSLEIKDSSGMQRLLSQRKQDTRSTFEWMLETGYGEDGLNNEYSEVLDIVSIYLTRKSKQKSCLHIIAEMIFRRHRKDEFIHDLTWAFFEVCDPYSLFIIAKYLNT